MIAKILLISEKEVTTILQDYDYRTDILLNLNNKEKKVLVKNIKIPGKELHNVHKNYLKKRGFDYTELVDIYKIQGTLMSPADYAYRIIVPIFYRNKLVSFHARDVTNIDKIRWKVLSPALSIINYKYTLYAEQFCMNKNKIGVVEGIADQWKLGKSFVATYGTALTNQQLKLLSKYDHIFFIFDSEYIAQNKAKQYAKILKSIRNSIQVEVIDLELQNDRDPGDLNKQEVSYIRKELGF